MVVAFRSQSIKTSMLSCMLSFYVFLNGLHDTSLGANQEQFSLKSWENLRIASLCLNFTGSYRKGSVIDNMQDKIRCFDWFRAHRPSATSEMASLAYQCFFIEKVYKEKDNVSTESSFIGGN